MLKYLGCFSHHLSKTTIKHPASSISSRWDFILSGQLSSIAILSLTGHADLFTADYFKGKIF